MIIILILIVGFFIALSLAPLLVASEPGARSSIFLRR
jgi:hypothetical protein